MRFAKPALAAMMILWMVLELVSTGFDASRTGRAVGRWIDEARDCCSTWGRFRAHSGVAVLPHLDRKFVIPDVELVAGFSSLMLPACTGCAPDSDLVL
jgi:hypothetical protein